MFPFGIRLLLIAAMLYGGAVSAQDSKSDPKVIAPEIDIYLKASPSLQAYFHRENPEMIMLASGFLANVCGFRSDSWYGAMRGALDFRWVRLQAESGLTARDLPMINKMNGFIFSRIAGHPNCNSITPEMLRELDKFQFEMTGGYH